VIAEFVSGYLHRLINARANSALTLYRAARRSFPYNAAGVRPRIFVVLVYWGLTPNWHAFGKGVLRYLSILETP